MASYRRAVARRGTRWVLLLVALGGCHLRTLPRPAPLPPELVSAGVRFQKTIAVLPFVDGRSAVDAEDSVDLYVYGGTEFRHTDLGELAGGPERAFAEALARHLVARHSFARVVLVDRLEDAPEAELVLSATLRRARGYVEANERPDPEEASSAPEKEAPTWRGMAPQRRASRPARPKDERTVLAEVWIEDVTVRSTKALSQRLLTADLGWSVVAERKATPKPPDPWEVLAEALDTAHGQLSSLLDEADLSGAFVAQDSTEISPTVTATLAARTSTAALFQAISEASPRGWRAHSAGREGWPIGWRGDRGRCVSIALEEAQSQRFHRALGPYRPTVQIYVCGNSSHLRFDPLVEFPAEYLGTVVDGAHLFVHALGRSSWKRPVRDLERFLSPSPPTKRHIFEIGSRAGRRAAR